ncbi:protein FAM8A1 [Neophocaena asiaeorientalis asiaeorientalis]|uniref:Protein FAM8A1 n=1 Tax=Neophocaena asiaeorientalis asiaeorientalis TaxID=1706337 RepID=A0A341CYY3_NEOAA|nr:protein FAM8A1 [Neophocaena asiaeorientalis asiaeorientalis]
MAEGPEKARGRPPGQDDGGGDHEPVPSRRGLPAAAPRPRDGPQAEPQAPGRPPAPGLGPPAAATEESEPPREPENGREAGSASGSGPGSGSRAPHVQPPARAAPATRVGPAAASRAPSETGRQAGREYVIPSLAHRFMAEMVDFFILFFIKATIVLSIMHLSGIKDISKFAMHYIIEEIDEDTSMEDLQKMMVVALIYRLLVCFYEIICIWGAGGATPGKFLLGLRVVTCDTSVLIAPSRVLVIPSSNVSITTSTIRALIKNFSIASFFPAFITLLFFQHNRTAYDIVAGTIVVKRNGVR